ncbi:MAG TPA: 5-formyltetrahydrofolate cyclo-ligase [Kofleriaceae bacterium]
MLVSIMRPKPITRRTVLSRRDALTADERKSASVVIADAAAQLVAKLPAGAVIALYAPKGSEVDTTRIDAFARARGLRVVYPRIVDGDPRLSFHEVTIDELVPSTFGLREPTPNAPVVALSEIAALVLPGLAFDRAGGRIGWGRGFYDATLAHASPAALRIGLAFECQVIEHAPREPHDAPLHYVVTEAAIYRAPD